MNAVGPWKGCRCTGRALAPTSMPTTVQPAKHTERLRGLYESQVRHTTAALQHVPRSCRRKQQHSFSVLKCRSWMWSIAPWLPNALNFLEPTRHIWRSMKSLSACLALAKQQTRLTNYASDSPDAGAHLCNAERRGAACYHAKVVALAHVVYDDIARRRAALLASRLALSRHGCRMLLVVAALAGVLHLSAHAFPAARNNAHHLLSAGIAVRQRWRASPVH